jgi:hypothetical protein
VYTAAAARSDDLWDRSAEPNYREPAEPSIEQRLADLTKRVEDAEARADLPLRLRIAVMIGGSFVGYGIVELIKAVLS